MVVSGECEAVINGYLRYDGERIYLADGTV